MPSTIKRFLNQSITYFVGNALNRFGVFILLPLYTNYLTPGEYGTLELVLVTVAFLRVLLGMRLGHATLRFYFEYDRELDKNRLISTSLISIMVWCLGLVLLLVSLSPYVSRLVFGTETYRAILVIGFFVMFFEVINEIPFAYFRAREYALLYVSSSVFQLVLRIALNIYILIILEGGVKGILVGNLISSSLLWILLCLFIFKSTGIVFDLSKLKPLFKYSYPLVIASLPGIVLRNADRVFLGWYTSLEAVGIYALAVRFGLALQGFVLEPFQLGYGPFRFSIMKQKNAKETYSKILTYFLLLVTIIGLSVAIFSREVIEVMASEFFQAAYKVIPLIVLCFMIRGLTYIFQTGILIQKRTDYLPYISILAATVNILSLFAFVPLFGIYGAAFSILISSLLDMALTYRFSQRLYQISFEWQRINKIIAVFLLLYLASIFTNGIDLSGRIFVKAGLIAVFPVLLIPLRFYTRGEIEKLFTMKAKISMKAFSAIGVCRTRDG